MDTPDDSSRHIQMKCRTGGYGVAISDLETKLDYLRRARRYLEEGEQNAHSRQDDLRATDGLPGRLRYVRIEAASWLTPWRGDRPEVAAAPQLAVEKWPGILKQPLRRQVCPNCLGPEADDSSLDGEVHPPRARRTLGRLDWLWVSVRKWQIKYFSWC
jgi:hypothetical protein